MKLISWNVNGLRACMGKGFAEYFAQSGADAFCLQETKLQPGQIDFAPEGYHAYWNYAVKKGYSGTAVFTKEEPLSVQYGMGEEVHDQEGRLITLEFPGFYLVTVYTPNAQRGLTRLAYRLEWEAAFRRYLKALDGKKPVVVCGDMNVAHQEVDLKNAKSNRGNAGFTDEEREAFSARENNAGWRIDYFVVSERLMPLVKDAGIDSQVLGSDHCPVTLELEMPDGGASAAR